MSKSVRLSVRLRKLQMSTRRAGSIAAFAAASSVCCSLPLTAAQAGGTTTRASPIIQMGCDTAGDSICFVYISPSAGPAGCNTTSLRFDPYTIPNGSATLSMLTQAFTAGRYVSFNISDTCFSQDPRFATFDYFFIE